MEILSNIKWQIWSISNRKMVQNIRYCAKTHKGLRKNINEDSWIVLEDIQIRRGSGSGIGVLFAVADGISGEVGGGKASKMAIRSLQEYFTGHKRKGIIIDKDKKNLVTLEGVVLGIHEKISSVSDKTEKYKYMGTTLSLLFICEMTAYIAHVGDSRIYKFRDGKLVKLTHDDTIAQLSVEMGFMKAEKALEHPLRHALIQALGQGVDEVQVKTEKLNHGDVFLLCTDGLYEMLSEKEIIGALENSISHSQACDILVERALKHGGTDNITVIVVQVL